MKFYKYYSVFRGENSNIKLLMGIFDSVYIGDAFDDIFHFGKSIGIAMNYGELTNSDIERYKQNKVKFCNCKSQVESYIQERNFDREF